MKHSLPVTLMLLTGIMSAPAYATSPNGSLEANASFDKLKQCPINLLNDAKLRVKTTESIRVFEHSGQAYRVSLHQLGGGFQCAMQISPELKALNPDDGLLRLDSAPTDGITALRAGTSMAKLDSCWPRATSYSVQGGRCGSNGPRLGSAFFVSQNLALSGGPQLQNVTDLCLVRENAYEPISFIDVHQTRKSGSGNALIAGLSTVRPGSNPTAIQYIGGALVSVPGASTSIQIEGMKFNSSACQKGIVNSDYGAGSFARFFWYSSSFLSDLTPLELGGPSYLEARPNGPMGIHTLDELITSSGTYSLHPWTKRFSINDTNTIANWIGTSAPSASQSITIDHPANGALINANLPLPVSVSSGSGYSLELNGWPVGNPITNIPEGTHTLVAYQTSAPQFRHTIRLEARRLISADSHEIDDAPTQWKPLYGNTRKFHNFHKPNDADWSAFGIDNGQILNVSMSGSAFGTCVLNLFIQPNYPNGTRQLVSTRTGSCASLNATHVTPTSPTSHVYFVEAKLSGSSSGSNTDYNLLLTTTRDPIAADAYETDDTREQSKPLFSGQPQQHNFHREGDVDWTGFGVGPNYAVTVTAVGTGAPRSRIRLFRQALYPNGPIELVATSEGKNTLTVFDQFATSQPFTVYYVEATPMWSGFYGNAAQYTLSVEAH